MRTVEAKSLFTGALGLVLASCGGDTTPDGPPRQPTACPPNCTAVGCTNSQRPSRRGRTRATSRSASRQKGSWPGGSASVLRPKDPHYAHGGAKNGSGMVRSLLEGTEIPRPARAPRSQGRSLVLPRGCTARDPFFAPQLTRRRSDRRPRRPESPPSLPSGRRGRI